MASYKELVAELVAEFDNIQLNDDEVLIEWLACMFAVACDNQLDALPHGQDIAKGIAWTRNLPDAITLPDEPPNYNAADPKFAAWLIENARTLATSGSSPTFLLDANQYWHLTQLYLGNEE